MYKMFHLKRTVTDEDEATGIYIVDAMLGLVRYPFP
jgi:hypothetical protein